MPYSSLSNSVLLNAAYRYTCSSVMPLILSFIIEIRCPLMIQPNGLFNTTNDLPGTGLLVSCNHGYLINGQSSMVAMCTENGEWSTEDTCTGEFN